MKAEDNPNFERFRTAITGGVPDRVPLAEAQIDVEVKERFLSTPVNEVGTDLRFWLSAGYDYIILGRRMVGAPPFLVPSHVHRVLPG